MSLFSRLIKRLQGKRTAPDVAQAPNSVAAPKKAPDDSSEFDEFDRWLSRQPSPPVAFAEITEVGAPPANDHVKAGVLYKVARNTQPKWVLFLCPCGCNNVITLSLQTAHRPHWLLYPSKDQRPTLRPSVWRDVGCFSHFILQDGRIYWCNDTGISPDVARTRYYRVG